MRVARPASISRPGADDRIATQGGESDGLLARIDPEFMPKVFYTNSSNEYWRASAALTHISADATDVTLLDNERIYLFAGTQHGPAGFPAASRPGTASRQPERLFLVPAGAPDRA